MISRMLRAGAILGVGLILTVAIFPWLDHVRDTQYHPTTPSTKQGVTTGDDTDIEVVSDNWAAQVFTVTSAYTIDSVRVMVWREIGVGTLTVAVYGADGDGFPTGTALTSATAASSTISLVTPGEWETITFETKVALVVGSYDVVLHYAGTGLVNWRAMGGGTGVSHSDDGGATWAAGMGGGDGLPPTEYTITSSVIGGNGTIAPDGAIPVTAGDNQDFVATPDGGYYLDGMTVDAVPLGGPGVYDWGTVTDEGEGVYAVHFLSVAADHTLTVTFAGGLG